MTSCDTGTSTPLQQRIGPKFRTEKMMAIDTMGYDVDDTVAVAGSASNCRYNTKTSKIKRRCLQLTLQSVVSLNNYVTSRTTVNTIIRQQVLTLFSFWMTLLLQFVMVHHSIQVTNSFSFYIPIHTNIIGFKINSAWVVKDTRNQQQQQEQQHKAMLLHLSSDDWSTFQAMDDDDDEIVYGKQLDKLSYATENDSPEDKAAVGTLRSAPIIERDADPISVPAGSHLELNEETVLGVLSACRYELGTLFGYTAENRGVGITGGVDYVDLDGPTVIVKLKGRFWHTRSSVLDRVANYLQQRIPEIVDVQIEDPWQLTDEANDIW